MDQLKKYIREVPNYPKPGILFYDVTTLFQSPEGMDLALAAMERYVAEKNATKIIGIEARGFVFAGALADRLELPFIPARKPGKLPYKTITESYSLEYGKDSLQIHEDAVMPGDRVVVVDDLLATGGTMLAVCRMVERLKGEVVGISTVIGLTFLPFEKALSAYDVNYLISYDSE